MTMLTTRNNYQLQGGNVGRTMTVRDLQECLADLPADMPVMILSPKLGTFGSEMPYGITGVAETFMPRMEQTNPAAEWEDEDTGAMVTCEAETQIWPEWRGVILQASDR